MDLRDQAPSARMDGLVVEDIDDETLVYDPTTHEAHCLNPAASLVWRRADGRTTVRELASALPEVGLPAEESLVWMALDRLSRAELVESLEVPAAYTSVSRKEALRALGLAAAMTLLLPAVDSVVAPLAAMQASCTPQSTCLSLDRFSCTGLPICTNYALCCTRKGSGCQPQTC